MKKKITAVIISRKNSKRLPNKMWQKLNGKSLIELKINHLVKSNVDEIAVGSDDLRLKKINSGIFNVGYGKPIKVKKVILLILKKIKKGTPLFGKLKMRKEEKKSLYPNISKTRKTFNWRPKIKLNIGIDKTIKFYKDK